MNIKRFFLSRTSVIIFIALLLGLVVAASLIPQAFLATPDEMAAWRADYPGFAPWAARFGMHHLYTTPWFAVVLLLALVSLILSCIEQCRLALGRTFESPSAAGERLGHSSLSEPDLTARLRRQGYLLVARGTGGLRFVKHPWGYWGNVLLHGGMVVVIASSLLIALTQQRGALALFEGEVHAPGDPWSSEENGLLAGSFVLPWPVRLDRVTPRFRPNHKISQIASEVSLLPPGGEPRRLTVEVNAMASHRGITVYQSTDVGHAFNVEFAGPAGRREVFRMPINHPESLEDAGYNDFRFPWLPVKLQAKYYVDADRKSLQSRTPLLVIRMMEGESEAGRAALRPGESGMLGPYRVRLDSVQQWTTLIFVRLTGMPGIFAGFFMVILGTVLAYCTPPRELVAVADGTGYLLRWRATKFAEFYQEERSRLLAGLRGRGEA